MCSPTAQAHLIFQRASHKNFNILQVWQYQDVWVLGCDTKLYNTIYCACTHHKIQYKMIGLPFISGFCKLLIFTKFLQHSLTASHFFINPIDGSNLWKSVCAKISKMQSPHSGGRWQNTSRSSPTNEHITQSHLWLPMHKVFGQFSESF